MHRDRLVRFFLKEGEVIRFQVGAELYVRGVTEQGLLSEDVDVRAWIDVDDHGYLDQKGIYRPGFGRFVCMSLMKDEEGRAILRGNNVVFISDMIESRACGVYGFTVEFSADEKQIHDPAKEWLSVNELSLNRDGIVVVSPLSVAKNPSVVEVCLRKCGARLVEGAFVSGGFKQATRCLKGIPGDVLYLLPFFLPGTGDAITGRDVRKGMLGSIYAVKDFYQVDPALVSPLEKVDLHALISEELISEYDLADLLTGRQQKRIRRVGDLVHFKDLAELADFIGKEKARQLVGRAELRQLVRRAHSLGKKVIFDMVLMQTSRDNPLVLQRRDWYQLDDQGHPKRHKIAWLDYSDVALFDLAFNKPLQSYLTSVVTYWMNTADLDGIRIDAAQTVDRPFLKQLCNHVHALKRDALVLGETLCALEEALDVPTDMIYSVMVDHHVRVEYATSFMDLFERYHHTFSPGTVAMAYFENHDSARATRMWRESYTQRLEKNASATSHWKAMADKEGPPAQIVALLKNLQATMINATAGACTGVSFSAGWELGSEYGEETRTDFENPVLLSPDQAWKKPGSRLRRSYEEFETFRKDESLLARGRVYYLRENLANWEDRILCFLRYDEHRVLVCTFNLDPLRRSEGVYRWPIPLVGTGKQAGFHVAFDSYRSFLERETGAMQGCKSVMEFSEKVPGGNGFGELHFRVSLPPLASVLAWVDVESKARS